jgi:transposase
VKAFLDHWRVEMADRYAGIDWASETHDVLVADETGAEVVAATFAHDENGLSALCRVLVRLEVVLVAIERPDGLLVERLLDAGLPVLPLHPNKVAAARDRFRVARGKSDRFDAFVLCELARTDHHRFRVLEPDCDQTKAIRALTRAREDLVAARTGIVNQLRAELERFWPGPLRLFSHMDAEILLAFLERYPDRDALAADAGQAAVAIESGKWKTGRACNKRLRVAFCRLADSSRHWHPWAQTLYAQARQRGHEHPRAIRTVGRAWCRVVWQCWRNHTPYDPARHRALQRHITVTIPARSGAVPDLAATQRMAGPAVTRRAVAGRARSA